jgi:hypothetical protein
MDAWWGRATAAIFAGNGDPISTLGIGLDDPNRIHHIGSSFQDGTYSHLNKDLHQVLGDNVKGRMSRTYCGGGNLIACRSALWASLALAATDLTTEFGSSNVADWQRTPDYEDIRHSAVGVTGVPAIHWVNRPTFQQVVQIPSRPPAPLGIRQVTSDDSGAAVYSAPAAVADDRRTALIS